MDHTIYGYQQNIWESQRRGKDNTLKQFITQWRKMKELQTTEVITNVMRSCDVLLLIGTVEDTYTHTMIQFYQSIWFTRRTSCVKDCMCVVLSYHGY